MQGFLDSTEPRKLAMILIALVVLVIGVQLSYLLWPQIKQFRNLSANHTTLDLTINSGDDLVRQLQNVEQEVSDLSQRLHGDMAQLPVKEMESFIIGRLQKLCWENNVELISVQPTVGKQVQNFRESLFEVRLNARYHDFYKWLQMIYQDLGYIVVEKFEIRPRNRQDSSDPQLDILLSLVSYRVLPSDS